jgi:hypothetical protein
MIRCSDTEEVSAYFGNCSWRRIRCFGYRRYLGDDDKIISGRKLRTAEWIRMRIEV